MDLDTKVAFPIKNKDNEWYVNLFSFILKLVSILCVAGIIFSTLFMRQYSKNYSPITNLDYFVDIIYATTSTIGIIITVLIAWWKEIFKK